ncbi:hypothetical protein HNQ76_002172 [Thermosulfuriphilus ammonigenes]|nr:hypothetical protein [Thermosulfuriphilus ammonigenes]MBA2849770.1 hypothetical protein [Thermosulfuriphilus ammonigenes]
MQKIIFLLGCEVLKDLFEVYLKLALRGVRRNAGKGLGSGIWNGE